MKKVNKILIISDSNYKPIKMYLDQMPKLAKGFVRLGNDVRHLSYCGILSQLSPFKSRSLSSFIYKKKADELIAKYAKHYQPDIVYISFAKHLDSNTLNIIRNTVKSTVIIGCDGDPWPEREKGRIETACGLDFLMCTNNGSFLDSYRNAGVNKCVFMPNICDPDIDRKYEVENNWKSDILWTGTVQHASGISDGDKTREDVINLLEKKSNTKIYGCYSYSKIAGLEYFLAISGAKIGISINAINDISMYHSDRITHYLACGTMVLAKRVPDSEKLFEDRKHLRYFDEPQECMEMIDWYLKNESERQQIADQGMQHCHNNFNGTKIAQYILDLVNTGQYKAPWGVFSI